MFTNKPWARSFANPSPGTACSSRPDRVQEAFPFKLVWFLKPEFFHLSFVLNAWWIWLTPGTLFTFSSASIKGCTRSRESKWYFLQTCRQHKLVYWCILAPWVINFGAFQLAHRNLVHICRTRILAACTDIADIVGLRGHILSNYTVLGGIS